MAKIAILANNNSIIASVSVPDSFSDYVKQVTGGTTNAEVAANFLAEILPIIRLHFYGRRLSNMQTQAQLDLTQSQKTAQDELKAGWGE